MINKMFWTIPFIIFLLIAMSADVFSKEYALKGYWYFWILALGGYTLANAFWLWSIRTGSGLARGSVIYCVVTAIFTSIVGLYFYGEVMNKVQISGIFLGVVSLVLIFWQ
jgi:drug/metabolite transporter (DMT)-like permease